MANPLAIRAGHLIFRRVNARMMIRLHLDRGAFADWLIISVTFWAKDIWVIFEIKNYVGAHGSTVAIGRSRPGSLVILCAHGA
jgi:hypothetical protein